MSIANDTMIKVYNYEESPCFMPSKIYTEGIKIEAGSEDNPSIELISYIDIELENSKADTFRTGRLVFEKDKEDEIYKKLNIHDRENILTENKIRKMLLNDDTSNLIKISKIESMSLITRIKDTMVKMLVSMETISPKIISVVNERYEEKIYGFKNENSFISRLTNSLKEEEKNNEILEVYKSMKQEVEKLKAEKEQDKNKNKETENALSDLLKMVQDLKAENDALKSGSKSENIIENTTENKEEANKAINKEVKETKKVVKAKKE